MGKHSWVYNDARWRGPWGIRTQRLTMEPTCRFCRQNGTIVEATVVDHVVPHRGDEKLAFDIDNTQSLCGSCHNSEKQQLEKKGWIRGARQDGTPRDPLHPWNVERRQDGNPTSTGKFLLTPSSIRDMMVVMGFCSTPLPRT